MNGEFKLYYVTGKDFYGVQRSVKTYARNPAEARDNALWILEKPGRVKRG